MVRIVADPNADGIIKMTIGKEELELQVGKPRSSGDDDTVRVDPTKGSVSYFDDPDRARRERLHIREIRTVDGVIDVDAILEEFQRRSPDIETFYYLTVSVRFMDGDHRALDELIRRFGAKPSQLLLEVDFRGPAL